MRNITHHDPAFHACFLVLADHGWSFALAAFTLSITGCLPLALLLMRNVGASGT
ncbi:hypothetical protein [Simplicispira metamorpha]|uniref:Uncharacterized protein n=1 Tax=Simplicispira metamorpha TaxID=80881 RepID=A0A4R2N8J3_9BURK|nr:hypothetical protein [Simplicispira metamorpha]TCP17238.1 hypothetical protein EV674_1132 [Simplicispira metamorpha]